MTYTSEDITVLEGLAPVRQVPAMYIGSTDSQGLHHCLQEVIDNSLDEHLAGHCDKISVILWNKSVVVQDNGRGIPVDIHPSTGVSTVETVLTKLHAGGKFFGNGKSGYKVSSGLHGVGISVVNALSSYLRVTVGKKGDGVYEQAFSKGSPLYSLEKKTNQCESSGTSIEFTPDPTIFETTKFQSDTIKYRLRELAYLNPELIFSFADRSVDKNAQFETIQFKDGIKQLIEDSLDKEEKLHPITEFHIKDELFECKVALVWTNTLEELVWSYVNNINTRSGGTHVTGVKTGLTKALMEFNSVTKTVKEDLQLLGEDLRAGLRMVISVLHENPQFEGQTKHKLNNSDLRVLLKDRIYEELIKYFADNMELPQEVLQKAYQLASIRQNASKKKELATVRSKIDNTVLLPGRLTSCSGKDPEKCELFIVEGLSAAGSASKQRDSKFQSVLALKGKVINAYRVEDKALFKNQELSSLLVALGIGTALDYSRLKYNKIIILTDADHDGEHIKALLLIYFITRLPEIVRQGYLYIAQPPLYRLIHKKQAIYLKDDKELQKFLTKLSEKERQQLVTTRMKGLGEMNSDELYTTTMDPAQRELLQVSLDTAAEYTLSILEKWSGADSSERKAHILQAIEEVQQDEVVNGQRED